MKVLKASRIERCIGCQICSMTCARQVHGLLSWQTAGIRIKSSGGISTGFEARYCMACQDPICVKACPTGALRPRVGGGVKLSKKDCIRCNACAQVCPVEAITFTETGFPVVCIHCGLCAKYCPHKCLEMVEPEIAHAYDQPEVTA
ncbi:MAG: 4Fe-4S dicluster domain-containing protein [Thermodesulfobacteria bacterium]|nr:4Fe-4S dicluster domain-containing protein [Thermodesulfobacteriota bacterium]